MNIEGSILQSLDEIGFKEPTRIQCETIPLIKEGHDVIGQSETGSGKTGAFGIPLVEKVQRGVKTQALILVPTRELALQITSEIAKFSRRKGLRIQCVYGGAPMGPQVSGIRSAEIVVGTPGRVMDHMRRGTLDVRNVRTFVLDEADKMIDMGFIDDIQTIERDIPEDRQTLMFSATMSGALASVRDRITKDAKKVKTATQVKEEDLKQYYCECDHNMKFSLLVHLLRKEDPELGLIFCNSRRDVDLVTQNLRNNGINAESIHGGLAQNRREHVIEKFHNGGIDVLVATDVAARGLDFKDITHIFNYSVPRDPEDYVNRIGRTARAGKRGKAIVLLSREDFDSLSRIVNTFDFDLQEIEANNVEVLPFKRNNYRDGGNGGRPFRGGGYGRRSEGNDSNSYGRRDRGYYGGHSGRSDRQGFENRSNDPALLSRGYSSRRNQYGSSSSGNRYN